LCERWGAVEGEWEAGGGGGLRRDEGMDWVRFFVFSWFLVWEWYDGMSTWAGVLGGMVVRVQG